MHDGRFVDADRAITTGTGVTAARMPSALLQLRSGTEARPAPCEPKALCGHGGFERDPVAASLRLAQRGTRADPKTGASVVLA